MKLVHIYIEEHKAIRHLNIPINGGFECSYKDGHLMLKKRNDRLSAYYSNVEISAIIGKNGTGKSTILNFLETLVLASDSCGLAIFYCNEKNFFYICNINNCNLIDVKILSEPSEDKARYECVLNYKEFIEINKIRFVNINNLSPEQLGLTLTKSKSHSSILNLTLKNNTRSQAQKRHYFSKLLSYFKSYYVSESFQEDIYFELAIYSSPLRIMYRAIESRINLNENNDLRQELREWSQGIHDIKLFNNGVLSNNLVGMNVLSILSRLSKLTSKNPNHQNEVLLYLVHTFAKLNLHHDENMSYCNCLRETVRSLEFKENWPTLNSEYSDLTSNDIEGLYNDINVNELKEVLESIVEQLFLLSKLIEEHNLEYAQVNSNVCKLEEYYLINKISELVNKLPSEVSSNIRMGWRGVSTGELAYSHIFSETFHYLTSGKLDSSNSIIILDEVDLYLHPEWQREFIAKFIELIQYCRNINGVPAPQVILTTHSPIIAGDFLPRDIVSLYKEQDSYGEERIVVRPSLGFGTSISDLYLVGMHLTAIFGEHSKGYIDAVIHRAQEKKLTDFDKKLIEQISDKHIRNYLLMS